MCGFLGEFLFDKKTDLTTLDAFSQLLALSKDRGPDSTQIESGNYYQLGFNRLAILDLSERGNQPKYSPSGRYHVVFNGEIYNYKNLEQKYELAHLRSTSDTEVLVHLLDILGIYETIKCLNGMFALAIIDTQTDDLYLSRDFAGIKPLFYGFCEQGIVAASQFNQIFKHAWFKDDLQLRPDVIKAYFGMGYMQAPDTIYKNILQLNPGEIIKIRRSGIQEMTSFKVVKNGMDHNLVHENSLKLDIKKTLQNAVQLQLRSDVPLASFLSGGIDSPLITAIAKQHNSQIKAFTMAVNDKTLDESVEATNYAEQLNLDHHIEHIGTHELFDHIEAHLKKFPEPFGDYSSIPTYLISKKAKQKHTVMLSGDGGDELFFGYPRFLDVYKKRYWFWVPYFFRRPMIRFTNKLGLTNTWAPYHYKTLSDWVMGKHSYIFDSELNLMFNNIKTSETITKLYCLPSYVSSKKLLQWLRYNEFYGHLQRILIKVDRMSMANSMEVRVPFLDKEVLQAAMTLHPEHFNSDKDLKRLLKDLMEDFYFKETISVHKKGFTVPLKKWLREDLKQDVMKVIFETPFYGSEYIDLNAVKNYVLRFYDKTHDSEWGVWHIYTWQKWAINQSLI